MDNNVEGGVAPPPRVCCGCAAPAGGGVAGPRPGGDGAQRAGETGLTGALPADKGRPGAAGTCGAKPHF